MARFSYTAVSARSKSDKVIKGEMEGRNRDDVIQSLTRQDLSPISIHEKSESKSMFGLAFKHSKVKSDEIVIFTRQLSAMVGAGVPLTRALTSLGAGSKNPAFKAILNTCMEHVQGGMPFSSALAKFPEVFNDVYVNMVRAGEAAGILDEILNRLAEQQERSSTVRKKVKGAMTYPMVLMGITVIAFFGLMIFVIPQIGNTIKDLGGPDAELPMLTQIMLNISGFIIDFWYIVLPMIAAAIYFTIQYIRTTGGKRNFHNLILKVPAVGGIIRKVVVARFARTYSALIGAGVSVVEALEVTGRAMGNVIYEEEFNLAIDRVKNGEQLSDIIGSNEYLFPTILPQMLAVGEETGQTDKVLIKIADFYEEEVNVSIDSMSSILEPVMIVLLGSMVGLVAVSVMGPIAGLSQNIQ